MTNSVLKLPTTKGGLLRIHGYGSPLPRVWVGRIITPGPITPSTILKIKDSEGHIEEVFAGDPQLQFS